MILDINSQKDQIKRNGILVDGKLYTIKFKVILDYKGFCLLLAKEDDEDFQLGGRGLDVEFCMLCHAIRLCTKCELGPNEVCLEHFAMTKANIGEFKGIRDDLTFLLDESMSTINICVLHCEMRNMEQLLSSLGLLSYEIGSLKECNRVLSGFGPQTYHGDRIVVKTKAGQESRIKGHNVHVSSFSGSTEREFLDHCDEIVKESLPKDKVVQNYFHSREAAEVYIENTVSYCQERVEYYKDLKAKGKYTRDFGANPLEDIDLTNEAVGEEVNELLSYWSNKMNDISSKYSELYDLPLGNSKTKSRSQKGKKKSKGSEVLYPDALETFAAELLIELHLKVFSDWKRIALTMRDKEFGQEEEACIDKFDLQGLHFIFRAAIGQQVTRSTGHQRISHG
ncbi:hypothetical protein QZH41_016345 [Actinostola sp. cb2023]|nr:hypothetical protein QZH41_016345 [Actinostola sp. cb2023]